MKTVFAVSKKYPTHIGFSYRRNFFLCWSQTTKYRVRHNPAYFEAACSFLVATCCIGLYAREFDNLTRSSAADGPRDAVCQSKSRQLLHSCRNEVYKNAEQNNGM